MEPSQKQPANFASKSQAMHSSLAFASERKPGWKSLLLALQARLLSADCQTTPLGNLASQKGVFLAGL